MAAPSNVAVFGLGSMGFGVATSLVRAGHRTHGFDVNADAVGRFVGEGGATGEAADVAGSLDAVVVVVLNAAQTEAVLFGAPGGPSGGAGGVHVAGAGGGPADGEGVAGSGIVARLRAGAVVVACATVPPAFARDMAARCADAGVHYLDAPISGGAAKAASGELSVMASGAPEAFAAARAALDAMATTVFELGDAAGAGSAMKAVNQLLAGVHIAAMAEAITFGMTQGVSPERFVEVIPRCAGTSWMLENRAPHVVEGDWTPRSAVDIWPKDLGIVLQAAREAGFAAPLCEAALLEFAKASDAGLGREDDAAVAKVYAARAGLSLPGS